MTLMVLREGLPSNMLYADGQQLRGILLSLWPGMGVSQSEY